MAWLARLASILAPVCDRSTARPASYFAPRSAIRSSRLHPWYENPKCDTNRQIDHGGRWGFMGVNRRSPCGDGTSAQANRGWHIGAAHMGMAWLAMWASNLAPVHVIRSARQAPFQAPRGMGFARPEWASILAPDHGIRSSRVMRHILANISQGFIGVCKVLYG
jgi:hypothetical protein